MVNRDTEATWRYHNGTKHPDGRLMNPHHRYDPMRNPLLLKIYEGLDTIPLSLDAPSTNVPALTAIANDMAPADDGQIPEISMVARILHFSTGITKTFRLAWGDMSFRAAACTGALYHIELYLVCGDLPGLEAGVYHFDPSQSTLRRLRKGDYRRTLVDATGDEPAVANAPAIVVYSDVFWRNAVKYQAREYRHAFWDSGTIIANALAVAMACGLSAKVVTGFVDMSANLLLDLDTQHEVAIALVPIGYAPQNIAGPSPEIRPLKLMTVPVSDYEIDFPAIREMHDASSLTNPAEVVSWRDGTPTIRPAAPSGTAVSLDAHTPGKIPQESVETVITRRGSARRFSHSSITFAGLSTLLERATQKISADFLRSESNPLNDIYLIVNAVDGLESGAYAYHRDSKMLELIRRGECRREAGQLALSQALGADASVNVYFLADLESISGSLGNRGYRAAQLEASITAGRFYLGAYALGLGATGLTFYDDAVTDFFSPHAQSKSVMFLVAVGRRARRT